jgi:hypothetical protein
VLLRWRKEYDAKRVEAFTAKQSSSREEALGARVAGLFRNLKMEEVYKNTVAASRRQKRT